MTTDIKQFFEVYPSQAQATMPVGIRINGLVPINGKCPQVMNEDIHQIAFMRKADDTLIKRSGNHSRKSSQHIDAHILSHLLSYAIKPGIRRITIRSSSGEIFSTIS